MQFADLETKQKVKLGVFLFLGLIAFGLSPIIVRLAGDSNPVALAVYRTILASLMLFPFWFFRHDTYQQRLGELKYMAGLKVFSGVALGIHFVFWISSLGYTSVASASVLVTIHPIILILVESMFFKIRFSSNVWIGVLITFLGSLLLGWSDHQGTGSNMQFEDALLGDFLAFSAAAVFVIYFLISRKLRQSVDWLDFVFNVYGYAAATTIVCALLLQIDLTPTPLLIICAASLALGPQIIGHGSMNFAVKYANPTMLSTLILIEPMFATFLAYLLFSEVPGVANIGAMLVVLIGVGLTWKRKRKSVESIKTTS